MRAAFALVLLGGFFVLALGITVLLGGMTVWQFDEGNVGDASWLGLLTLAFGGPALWAMARALFSRPAPTGIPMPRENHPELWHHVDELARLAGTRGPDDIRLVNEANAGVWERGGVRYLELGLPLVAGMAVGELRAVLAHELGHYGGGHTQTSSLAYRAKMALDLSVHGCDLTGLGSVLYGYAKVYSMVAASVSRDHERFADEVAAQAGGRELASRAWLRIRPLGVAWSDYLESYVSLAVLAQRTPPVLDGFRSYLDHPRRVAELRDLETRLAAEQPKTVFDSHPPTRERVAAMARMPGVDTVVADERPAWMLLDGIPPEAFAELLGVRGPEIAWEDLAPLSGPSRVRLYADALKHAGRVSKVGETLGEVLNALERGQLYQLTGAPVDLALDDEQVRRAAVETVTELLACAVAHQLVEAGKAGLELNWGGMFVLRMWDGAAVYPDDLVAPAVRDPGQVPLVRVRLQAIGVDGL